MVVKQLISICGRGDMWVALSLFSFIGSTTLWYLFRYFTSSFSKSQGLYFKVPWILELASYSHLDRLEFKSSLFSSIPLFFRDDLNGS